MATIDLEFSKNEDAYLLKLAKLDREKESIFLGAVSYTHLTLPTIYSV